MNETNISTIKDNYGGLWVKDLLKYVVNLTKEGMEQQELLRMLLIGKGLKPQKAKEFLSDFAELGFITFRDNKFWSLPNGVSIPKESETKEECAYCKKDITAKVKSEQFFQKHSLKFCNKTCSDKYFKQEGK